MNSVELQFFTDLETKLWTGYPQSLREPVAEQVLALAELTDGDDSA